MADKVSSLRGLTEPLSGSLGGREYIIHHTQWDEAGTEATYWSSCEPPISLISKTGN